MCTLTDGDEKMSGCAKLLLGLQFLCLEQQIEPPVLDVLVVQRVVLFQSDADLAAAFDHGRLYLKVLRTGLQQANTEKRVQTEITILHRDHQRRTENATWLVILFDGDRVF